MYMYIYIYMLESAGGFRLLSIISFQFHDNTLVGAVQQPTACQSRKQRKGRKACRAGRRHESAAQETASIPSVGEVSTLSKSSKPRRQRRCRKATLGPKRAKTRRKSSTCNTKPGNSAREKRHSARSCGPGLAGMAPTAQRLISASRKKITGESCLLYTSPSPRD